MGWCWLCVRGELETETDCHILTPSSSDHSSTSFAFWLGCSTGVSDGPSPLSGAGAHSAGILSPTTTRTHCLELTASNSNSNCDSNSKWPKPSVALGYIIVYFSASCVRTHMHRIQPRPQSKWYSDILDQMHLFLRLFTQVHLLIDSLVEGKYATQVPLLNI